MHVACFFSFVTKFAKFEKNSTTKNYFLVSGFDD